MPHDNHSRIDDDGVALLVDEIAVAYCSAMERNCSCREFATPDYRKVKDPATSCARATAAALKAIEAWGLDPQRAINAWARWEAEHEAIRTTSS